MNEENLPAIVNEQEHTEPAPISTPAQARVDAVATLTMAAIQRASTLVLTPEESRALQADFPDEAFKSGAAGKEKLLYIEHAFLRDRLNQVLGIGQWSLIQRARWTEQKGNKITIYSECMLLVRGCYVAEAIGDMDYFPNNAQANFGDACEGSKSAALRRCCKEFGVGLQAWKKDWCEGWWHRRGKKLQEPQQSQQVERNEPTKQEKPNERNKILADLVAASEEGMQELQTTWTKLTIPQKNLVGKSALDEIKKAVEDRRVRAMEAKAAILKRLYAAADLGGDVLAKAYEKLPPDEKALISGDVEALEACAMRGKGTANAAIGEWTA